MSSFGGGRIVTNGLTLELDAANVKSYPGSGTAWADKSGLNNNATLINGPTFNSGNNGYVIFDGSNDYVHCGAASSGSASGTYTYGGWFKTINGTLPYCRGRDGSGNGWSTAISYSSNKLNYSVVTTSGGAASYGLTSIGTYTDNLWYYVIGIWKNGIGGDLYVNGVYDNSFSTATSNLRTSTEGWVMASITTGLFYPANIATFTVYNRALTAQEIRQNYTAQKSRFGL